MDRPCRGAFALAQPGRCAARLGASAVRLGAIGLCLAAVLTARAQLRPVVVQGATVSTGDGAWLDNASVSFAAGVISAAGVGVEAPLLAQKIDARGKFVTPGLVDVWNGGFAQLGPSPSQGIGYARDAFNVYDDDARRAAWREGVTAVYLPARTASGIGGYGAVVRLRPGADLEACVVAGEVALHTVLGIDPRQRPIARARAALDLRKALISAREYRKALEQYDLDLKEYEKKVAERAAQQADGDPSTGAPRPETRPAPARPAPARPAPARPARSYQPDEAAQEAAIPPDHQTHPAHADPEPADHDVEHADQDGLSPGHDGDALQVPPRRIPRRPGTPTPTPQPASPARPAAADSKDELKKPTEPRKDRISEALLRVMDGELALRVEADWPEDITTLLDLAEQYHLPLILEGATAAPQLAERIARLDIPVILAAAPPALLFDAGTARFYQEDAAGVLTRAGIRVFVGSGTSAEAAGAAPRLALRAALAVRGGLNERDALAGLTGEAARLLGVEKKLGRLAKGLPADLVIWSAHPFSAEARVERVYVDGQLVYRAPRPAGGPPADDAPEGE